MEDGIVWVVVKPQAREEKVELVEGVWYVHVRERAKEGAANSAVAKLLAKVWKKRVRIVGGLQSRRKKVEVF